MGGWRGHIHSSSFIFSPSVVVVICTLKQDGGAQWDRSLSTVRGALHAILVKAETDMPDTRLLNELFFPGLVLQTTRVLLLFSLTDSEKLQEDDNRTKNNGYQLLE